MFCKHQSPTGSTHCPPLTELSHCNMDKVLGSKYHHVSAHFLAVAAREVPQQPRRYTTKKPTQWLCIQLPTGRRGSQGDSRCWGGTRNRALFPVESVACTEVVLSKCQDSVTRGTHPVPGPAPTTLRLGSPGNHLWLFSARLVLREPNQTMSQKLPLPKPRASWNPNWVPWEFSEAAADSVPNKSCQGFSTFKAEAVA